jgi:hypothetical protein
MWATHKLYFGFDGTAPGTSYELIDLKVSDTDSTL